MTIRVVLADDHAIVREGLRALLDHQPDMQVAGMATNGHQAIRLVDECAPDVAVLDISMPDLNGIEAIQRMLPRHPGLRVVVLSIHSTKPYVFRALKAGASGYLIKETAGLEVAEAIRAVHKGERYLSQHIEDLLDNWEENINSTAETSPLDQLTRREREVLQMVAEGKSSREIAEVLSISSKTVDSYRSRLMQKLGVEDVTGLVKFAIRYGVITLE